MVSVARNSVSPSRGSGGPSRASPTSKAKPAGSGGGSPKPRDTVKSRQSTTPLAKPSNAQRADARRIQANDIGAHNRAHNLQKEANGQTPGVNAAALQGPAAMMARREFNQAPLNPSRAVEAYGNLGAKDFAGPDDMRLRQVTRAAQQQNVDFVRNLDKAMKAEGIDNAAVYGRAKAPGSIYGNLEKWPDMKLKEMKDLSGARVDLSPTKPGFQEYGSARKAAEGAIDGLELKKDFIKNPTPQGYTGRTHHLAKGAHGVHHELQIGSKDLSNFIDKKLTSAGGDKITVHDATYKGKMHGVDLPEGVSKQYPELMGKITDANKAGQVVDDVPELKKSVDGFMKQAEQALPDRIQHPKPQLSTRAKLGNAAGKGMGALGVVGGGFQMNNGVQQLKDGKVVEGGADVVGGAGNIASGAAMMAGRVGLGTTTGGAVAVVDGVKDMYVGIRDKNVEKGVTGAVKTGAGSAMIAGVATANPVLIAGGAAAYAGAVIYENREAIADGAKKAWGWVKSWF